MRQSPKPVIIFDFDGTIADTFVLAIDIFYKLKPRWPVLPKGEVERLRGMAMHEVARELRIPIWHIPFLLIRGRKMMAQELGKILIIPGMDDVIRSLNHEGYTLCVISSNSRSNVATFLAQHQLLECFAEVKGSASLFGKKRIIKKLLKKLQVAPGDAYYIGDEARDIDAAHAAGVHALAVSWGYNNIEVLHARGPERIIFDPADITKAVATR